MREWNAATASMVMLNIIEQDSKKRDVSKFIILAQGLNDTFLELQSRKNLLVSKELSIIFWDVKTIGTLFFFKH